MSKKTKLTLSIDRDILKKAKQLIEGKNVSLSKTVEKFLEFIIAPHFYCFKCGTKFDSNTSKLCPKCGWLSCPECGACRCVLNEDSAIAVFHMRRVYEDLLFGRVK